MPIGEGGRLLPAMNAPDGSLVEALVAPVDIGRAEAAAECRALLARSRRPVGRWLDSAPLRRLGGSSTLAPVAAWESLADLALPAAGDAADRALGRRAGPANLLSRGLEHSVLEGVTEASVIDDALAARREDGDLTQFATRAEFVRHHSGRDRPLPLAALRAFGGESERRLVLLGKGITARAIADGLSEHRHRLGRRPIALTLEDLARHRVAPRQLAEQPAPDALRRAVAEQIVWARRLLATAWSLAFDVGFPHAAWVSAWLRRTESSLGDVERAGFGLEAPQHTHSARRRELATLTGALWWLPPRSVAESAD
ncbi:MAG: squalene/phytoene synthase family protein [Planctomycetota bacterium]